MLRSSGPNPSPPAPTTSFVSLSTAYHEGHVSGSFSSLFPKNGRASSIKGRAFKGEGKFPPASWFSFLTSLAKKASRSGTVSGRRERRCVSINACISLAATAAAKSVFILVLHDSLTFWIGASHRNTPYSGQSMHWCVICC